MAVEVPAKRGFLSNLPMPACLEVQVVGSRTGAMRRRFGLAVALRFL